VLSKILVSRLVNSDTYLELLCARSGGMRYRHDEVSGWRADDATAATEERLASSGRDCASPVSWGDDGDEIGEDKVHGRIRFTKKTTADFFFR
jgi:hypothetical protein